jgi:hypothetical protein
VVHVVSDFQGEGVLIGILQHLLWQLETSYKTGMKTITSDDAEYTFPYSVEADGTLFVPGTTKAIKTARTKKWKAERIGGKGEIRPNPSLTLDSPTASMDPRASSRSFPAVAKKFQVAGRKYETVATEIAAKMAIESTTAVPARSQPGRSKQSELRATSKVLTAELAFSVLYDDQYVGSPASAEATVRRRAPTSAGTSRQARMGPVVALMGRRALPLTRLRALQLARLRARQLTRLRATQLAKLTRLRALQLARLRALQLMELRALQRTKLRALQLTRLRALQLTRLRALQLARLRAL